MKHVEEVMSREQRTRFINRVEVLEKVKALLMIPKLSLATTEQVAEYFGVPSETIRTVYKRNKEELDANGAVFMSPTQLNELTCQDETLVEDAKGSKVYCVGDCLFEIANRGTRFYPPRAILCMAMLLRDSPVAAEVRTQLLNLAEAAPIEILYARKTRVPVRVLKG